MEETDALLPELTVPSSIPLVHQIPWTWHSVYQMHIAHIVLQSGITDNLYEKQSVLIMECELDHKNMEDSLKE
jgi:hypothetical protein